MIDTLVLYQAGENGQDFDLNLRKLRKDIGENEIEKDKYYKTLYEDKKQKTKSIDVRYFPFKSYFKVSFSVPKLLQGNSLENFELSELSEIHSILENRLKGILQADFNNMKIARIDVSKNIDVENDVSLYLLACDSARAEQKKYGSYKYGSETIMFSNNSRRITLYDKVKEILSNDKFNELAREYKRAGSNILRFEIQHKGSKSISTHLKELSKDLSISTLYRNSKKYEQEFKKYLLNEFRKFFCYSRQYELFVENTGIIYAVNEIFGKRNLVINTLAKKYLLEHQDFRAADFSKLFIEFYKSERNIFRIRKQLDELQKLGNMTKIDFIDEIEQKLVA